MMDYIKGIIISLIILTIFFLGAVMGYNSKSTDEVVNKEVKLNWEHIAISTHRMKVPGGWLVRITDYEAVAMVFIEDEKWEWRID